MKNYFCSLLLLLLVSIPMSTNAQKVQSPYSVKGVLVDSISKESEPYATIRIAFSKNPEKPVQLAITSDNGKFNDPEKSVWKYTVKDVQNQD